MTRRLAVVGVIGLAACSPMPSASPPRTDVHRVEVPDDVRWPLERRVFAGTVRHVVPAEAAASIPMIELADSVHPATIAIAGSHVIDQLADGDPVVVSGIGRRSERAEASAGATISLRDVRVEHAPVANGVLRTRTDLEVEIRKTYVRAEGTLVARPASAHGDLLLALAPDVHVPVMVTVDGEAEALAHAGTVVRLRGYLMPTPDERRSTAGDVLPGLAIGQPVFE